MTDYITELPDDETICEYVDDGMNQAVLVTLKASVLRREFREPAAIRKVMRIISRLKPSR